MIKPRRGAEPSMTLILIGVLLFTAADAAGPFRTPTLVSSIAGLLVFLTATAYRYAVPMGTGGRMAFAIARGCALWLLFGGLLYTALSEAPTSDILQPLFLQLDSVFAERFWFPAAWLVLAVICYVFGPKGHTYGRP